MWLYARASIYEFRHECSFKNTKKKINIKLFYTSLLSSVSYFVSGGCSTEKEMAIWSLFTCLYWITTNEERKMKKQRIKKNIRFFCLLSKEKIHATCASFSCIYLYRNQCCSVSKIEPLKNWKILFEWDFHRISYAEVCPITDFIKPAKICEFSTFSH